MGASQSVDSLQQDGLLNRFKRKEERSVQQISSYSAVKSESYLSEPTSIPCIIYIHNGVRKIYVAQWHVAFYKDNGTLSIDEKSGPVSGGVITIDKSDAIILYNIYRRWQDYKHLARAGVSLVEEILKSRDSNLLD
jgi:uncharacterized protein YycO